MPEIAIYLAGTITGAVLVGLACIGHWMRHAETGTDPFADLPTFDDAEADRLLEQGA